MLKALLRSSDVQDKTLSAQQAEVAAANAAAAAAKRELAEAKVRNRQSTATPDSLGTQRFALMTLSRRCINHV